MAVESDFRGRIAKLLRACGYMVQAVETGAIAEGVPDLWYSKRTLIGDTASLGRIIRANGVTHTGWLELKKIREMPKRATTQIFKSINHPLSVEQENWITMAMEHGTRADILVAYEREYFFVPGRYAEQFNAMTEEILRTFKVDKADIPNLLL